MKRGLIVLVLALVLVMAFSALPVGASGEQGSCPTGWHEHPVGHHDDSGEHHGEHRHVGTDADQNGDGLICVKHVGPNGSIHVHTDNNAGKKG